MFVLARTSGIQNFDVSLTGAPETLESTYIASNLSRWKEESQALDGHTSHLAIATLRPLLINELRKEYEKEKKKPTNVQTTSKQDVAGPSTVSANEVVANTINSTATERQQQEEIQVVPSLSVDEPATTVTPRNGSQSVEQLGTSLRAVADALAQTVAEVRNTRRLLGGGANENSTPPTTSQQDVSNTVPPRSVSSMPDLSTFDGSQDSARAILSQITPDDPLYTFLSAVARAPTPPLPESVSQPVVSTCTSPRLPVFTQIISHNQPSVVITVPVISNNNTTQPTTTSNSDTAPTVSAQGPPTNQIQSLDNIPSHVSQSVLAGSNFADVLATELARAVSNHLHPPTTTTTGSYPVAPTDSPSPSDTLAPMMSSLQMPPSTSNTATVTPEANTTTGTATATVVVTNEQMQTEQTPVASGTASTNDNELPDDIDPTFLAALPDSIRREVLSQYMREQHRSLQQSQQSTNQFATSINPEVLAALPPEIQEEVS